MEQRRADITSRAVCGESTASITTRLQRLFHQVICKNTIHIITNRKVALCFCQHFTILKNVLCLNKRSKILSHPCILITKPTCLGIYITKQIKCSITHCNCNKQIHNVMHICFSPLQHNHIRIKTRNCVIPKTQSALRYV